MLRCVALAALLVLGCGRKPQAPYPFALVVHNASSLPESVTWQWWTETTIRGSERHTIPAFGSAVYTARPARPDGFELTAVAWAAGAVWQSPDYRGARVFHVVYPTGASWGEVGR